ncbi:hypothetical protein CEP54_009376 [Fusarium duplospermum]|uniref:Uncharacterized protein n=1 Tax=Fusarium duplospermum TaxID=1325734 RepID=A0A428PR34_9HYPO|nr:hypothetical protein CEP54_009376 [Fusarium duplospermum]
MQLLEIHGLIVRPARENRADLSFMVKGEVGKNGSGNFVTIPRSVKALSRRSHFFTILSVGYPSFNYDKEHISNTS